LSAVFSINLIGGSTAEFSTVESFGDSTAGIGEWHNGQTSKFELWLCNLLEVISTFRIVIVRLIFFIFYLFLYLPTETFSLTFTLITLSSALFLSTLFTFSKKEVKIVLKW
jgi:hypothetical protein